MRTGLTLLAVTFFTPLVISGDLPKEAPPAEGYILGARLPQDLKRVRESPWGMMFVEQATTKGDPKQPLIITSALGEDGNPIEERISTRKSYIILADSNVDDFTKEGGVYWRQGKASGTVKFKRPGALIMIVRMADGSVNWFTLEIDWRC